MEKISVIVPIYNVAEYLDQCVESIVNQTYTNLEIILVDDGSTDDSGNKAELWKTKDKRIKVVHKTNGGLSDARNAGLEVATGELIGYVDSDDWIDVTMYEKLYQVMLDKHSSIAACQFVEVIDGIVNESSANNELYVFEGHDFLRQILSNQSNPRLSNSVWKFLYRRELVKDMTFDKGHLYEDAMYTFPVCINIKVIPFLNEPLYFYRQRSDSIMGTKLSKRHVEDMLRYQDGIRQVIMTSPNEALLKELDCNYYKMLLEYRYLCSKDKALKECYISLTNRIKESSMKKTDIRGFSSGKYVIYRYFPGILARIKR